MEIDVGSHVGTLHVHTFEAFENRLKLHMLAWVQVQVQVQGWDMIRSKRDCTCTRSGVPKSDVREYMMAVPHTLVASWEEDEAQIVVESC